MAKLIPAVIATLLLVVTLTGCVAQQSRDNPDRDVFTGVDVEPYTYRHGEAGQEIAELFNTGSVYAAQQDYSGSSHGLRPNAFYTVSIAEDPLRPTVLTTVGHCRCPAENKIFFGCFFSFCRSHTQRYNLHLYFNSSANVVFIKKENSCRFAAGQIKSAIFITKKIKLCL